MSIRVAVLGCNLIALARLHTQRKRACMEDGPGVAARKGLDGFFVKRLGLGVARYEALNGGIESGLKGLRFG